jgi:hypothetical protein
MMGSMATFSHWTSKMSSRFRLPANSFQCHPKKSPVVPQAMIQFPVLSIVVKCEARHVPPMM